MLAKIRHVDRSPSRVMLFQERCLANLVSVNRKRSPISHSIQVSEMAECRRRFPIGWLLASRLRWLWGIILELNKVQSLVHRNLTLYPIPTTLLA